MKMLLKFSTAKLGDKGTVYIKPHNIIAFTQWQHCVELHLTSGQSVFVNADIEEALYTFVGRSSEVSDMTKSLTNDMLTKQIEERMNRYA